MRDTRQIMAERFIEKCVDELVSIESIVEEMVDDTQITTKPKSKKRTVKTKLVLKE